MIKPKICLSAVCIVASFFSSYYILIPTALTAVILSQNTLSGIKNVKFYLLALLFATLPAIFLPMDEAAPFAGRIILRMIAVSGGFLTIASYMNFDNFRTRIRPLLGEDFSRSLALSMNLFPSMKNDLEAGWAVMHLNSSRRPRIMGIPKMAVRCAVRNAGEISMRIKVRERTLPEVVIVTGRVNSGKTFQLKKIIEKEREKGNHLVGFIASGRHSGSEKIGFDAENINTGERIPLSRRDWAEEKGDRAGWCVVSRKAVKWVEKLFEDIPSESVLVIDEAGPLELKGGGFDNLIRKAALSSASRIYISSRDICYEAVKERYFSQQTVKKLSV